MARWCAHAADRAVAQRHRRRRRGAVAVLSRHRPRAHHPRRHRHRVARGGGRHRPAARRRRIAAPHLRGRGGAAPRETQYFEMLGSRAIYHDGWKATTDHVGRQLSVETEMVAGQPDFEADRWALYDLHADASESFDRSAETSRPSRTDGRPVGGRGRCEPGASPRRQLPVAGDGRSSRAHGVCGLAPRSCPEAGRSTRMCSRRWVAASASSPRCRSTRATTTASSAALGDWSNGWALFVDDGRPTFAVNRFGELTTVRSPKTPSEGARTITVDYRRGRGRRWAGATVGRWRADG